MKIIILFFVLIIVTLIFSQVPDGYYNNCSNKQGQQLKNILHELIKDHKEFSYKT